MTQPGPDAPKSAHILATVRRILARDGYKSATISQIAREAGVSRGLLHYYFKNKEEMLLQVVQNNLEIVFDRVQHIFSRIEHGENLARALSRSLKEILINDPDFFTLFVDGWFLSRRGEINDARMIGLHRQFREAIEAGLARLQSQGIIQPSVSVPGLAFVLTSLVDGAGMQIAIEPELAGRSSTWQTMEATIAALLHQ